MGRAARKTVHRDPRPYRAVRKRAAKSGETISSVVSGAVREPLREDEIDLRACIERKNESSQPLSDVLRDLRLDGHL